MTLHRTRQGWTPKRDDRPHSRACGITDHPHGTRCSPDCPTCHGQNLPPETHASPADPDPTEPRYTLAEARRLLLRQDCLRDGHDLEQEVHGDAAGKVIRCFIWCSRCGAQFTETGGPWT